MRREAEAGAPADAIGGHVRPAAASEQGVFDRRRARFPVQQISEANIAQPAGAVASATLGFTLMVPLLLLLPPATALVGLLASEIATLAWSVAAFRGLSRGPRGAAAKG